MEKVFPEFKLRDMFAHGLFTRFNEPISNDLYIPSEHDIKKLIYIFSEILNGKKIKKEKINCVVFNDFQRVDFSKAEFSKRVKDGLVYSVKFGGFDAVLSDREIFGREWVFDKGTLSRYREGKKQEWESKVNEYFTEKELEGFDNFHRTIKPYVGLTNTGALIDPQ